MTVDGVRAMIAAKVRIAGSPEKLAAEWRVSAQYIRQVAAAKVAPGKLILSRLGLERVVSYRSKREVSSAR